MSIEIGDNTPIVVGWAFDAVNPGVCGRSCYAEDVAKRFRAFYLRHNRKADESVSLVVTVLPRELD